MLCVTKEWYVLGSGPNAGGLGRGCMAQALMVGATKEVCMCMAQGPMLGLPSCPQAPCLPAPRLRGLAQRLRAGLPQGGMRGGGAAPWLHPLSQRHAQLGLLQQVGQVNVCRSIGCSVAVARM